MWVVVLTVEGDECSHAERAFSQRAYTLACQFNDYRPMIYNTRRAVDCYKRQIVSTSSSIGAAP